MSAFQILAGFEFAAAKKKKEKRNILNVMQEKTQDFPGAEVRKEEPQQGD